MLNSKLEAPSVCRWSSVILIQVTIFHLWFFCCGGDLSPAPIFFWFLTDKNFLSRSNLMKVLSEPRNWRTPLCYRRSLNSLDRTSTWAHWKAYFLQLRMQHPRLLRPSRVSHHWKYQSGQIMLSPGCSQPTLTKTSGSPEATVAASLCYSRREALFYTRIHIRPSIGFDVEQRIMEVLCLYGLCAVLLWI